MDATLIQYFLSMLLADQSFIQGLMDLILKSTIVIVMTALAAFALRDRLANGSVHLLWVNSLFCIALLPFANLVIGQLPAVVGASTAINLLTIHPNSSAVVTNVSQYSNEFFVVSYLLVCALVATRILRSASCLRRLEKESIVVSDSKLLERVSLLCAELGISREVSLRLSRDVDSPLSYGLFTVGVNLSVVGILRAVVVTVCHSVIVVVGVALIAGAITVGIGLIRIVYVRHLRHFAVRTVVGIVPHAVAVAITVAVIPDSVVVLILLASVDNHLTVAVLRLNPDAHAPSVGYRGLVDGCKTDCEAGHQGGEVGARPHPTLVLGQRRGDLGPGGEGLHRQERVHAVPVVK